MDRSNAPATDGGTRVSDTGTVGAGSSDNAEHAPSTEGPGVYETHRRMDRWLAAGLVALAVALAANSVIGPLIADLVSYPFSETLVNQTIGLEAVTLALVVPWSIAAAALVACGHRAGPILALAPSSYTVYMFVQYVLGPEYLTYRPVVAFHLGIFVLGGAVLVLAWHRIRTDALPVMSTRRARLTGAGVFLLAAFVVFRYVPSFGGILTGGSLSAEFASDPTMFWSIFLLDLGVVAPISVATAVGLLRGAAWARKVAYGVVGWYVPVPISVSAMGVVMLVNDDPNASLAMVAVLAVAAVLFTAFAVWVYRPLFGRTPDADGS